MNKEKKQALEKAGFVFQDAEDFLNLTPGERRLVELRVAVSRAVRELRTSLQMTQQQLAERMKSNQARVARMETGAAGVSLDMMFKGLFALGGTIENIQQQSPRQGARPRRGQTGAAKTRGVGASGRQNPVRSAEQKSGKRLKTG